MGYETAVPRFGESWTTSATLTHVANKSVESERVVSGGLAPWQLSRAKEIYLENLARNLLCNDVARACKLSGAHFARAFKASTGLPPHQWVKAARIELARDLLENSSTPLVDIAGVCGFSDQSHFSRIFFGVMGTSPGMWRREHRTAPTVYTAGKSATL